MTSPRLDHIVVCTHARDDLVADLAKRSGLPILDGWAQGARLRSRGVRFGAGPFFDVFDWPEDKEPPHPLIAIEDQIGRIAALAEAQGWRYAIQRREDEPEETRPPWSTLSFRKRQGVLSRLFVIEYARVLRPPADYRGFLYDPDYGVREKSLFGRVVMGAADPAIARAQLVALGWSALIDIEASAQDCVLRAEWLGPGGAESWVADSASQVGITRP